MKFEVEYLVGQGSGSNPHGKFYMAVLDHTATLVAYGPNGPASTGQIRKLANYSAVVQKLTQKRREYTAVSPNEISGPAKKRLADELRKIFPKLKNSAVTFTANHIEFTDESTSQKDSRKPVKPRRGKQVVHVWI